MSRYKENRSRVYEIYGIDENDRRYNTHHIKFRSDFEGSEREEMHDKANLIPLKIEDHDELHRRISELEKGIKCEGRRKNKTTKRKPQGRKKSRRRF